MKIIQTLLVSAAVAVASPFVAAQANEKQVFHVHGPRVLFEAFYGENKAALDLWSSKGNADGTIDAEVYGKPSLIRQLVKSDGRALREGDSSESSSPFRVLEATATNAALAAQDKDDVAACHERTADYIKSVGSNGAKFTTSTFHDCWRNSQQVFEYLDKLVELAPTLITKLEPIGETCEKKKIYAYKISTGRSTAKQALFGQGLIHAREWQSGGSVFYVIAGLLDALQAGDARVKSIFDKYDWYFVPILNVDGYDYTWTDGNRLWRKNRCPFKYKDKDYVGVDLNRNFGPVEFFDVDKDSEKPTSEIYPGSGVLSEPESAAVWKFLRSLPDPLAGAIDVHMNSQTIIRPFSNSKIEAPEPYQSKLTVLGDAMRKAIQTSDIPYGNVMGGTGSYLAYGTFKDAIFLEFNKAPGYTLELERADGGFISSQTTIRDVGERTLKAFLAFSEGLSEYYSFKCS